jgi:hypothetical protein
MSNPPLTFESFPARSLVTLVIPQGYTLPIAGAFAVAVHRYGFPLELNAWGFVAGAVAAFVTLAVIARRALSGSIAALPSGLRALINVVPLLVVVAVAGIVALIRTPLIGFPVAGLLGAAGYVVVISMFLWAVARGPRSNCLGSEQSTTGQGG